MGWADVGRRQRMTALVTPLSRRGQSDAALWGVILWLGTERRVAEIFPSRAAALADCAWRESEVRAYLHLLRGARQPVPRYAIAPVRRTDLPRNWRPLPALGFLGAHPPAARGPDTGRLPG